MAPPRATVAFVPREVFSTTRRSLEALYERTSEPFELVCIDGGSPPELQQYLEEQARQKQFTLVRSDCYLTPNQARNLALPHVRTPYVVWLSKLRKWIGPKWTKTFEKRLVAPFESAPNVRRPYAQYGTAPRIEPRVAYMPLRSAARAA